jgi:hypothetical protein
MQDNVTLDMVLHGLDVEFTGELKFFDESFTHEFGTEKITFWAVDEPKWDKSMYTDEQNNLIHGWLYQERNYDKVCQLLTDKIK